MSLGLPASPSNPLHALRPRSWLRCRATSWTRCPGRAAKFASARPDPAPDREATFAEAQPWLTGPYRAAFMKRFEPKLGDPAFRTAAEANGKVLPEWTAAAPPPAAKAKAEPTPPPVPEKPKEPERTWHWPWETPKK